MDEQIVQAAQAVIALIFAFGGIVPLVNKIKTAVNSPPRYTQLILVSVIVVYVIATGFIQGLLVADSFTLAQESTTFVAILTASQAEYQRVRK